LETLYSHTSDTRIITHDVTPQRLFEDRMPEPPQAAGVLRDVIQEAVVALEQVEAEPLSWNRDMSKEDAKNICWELWCTATHGEQGNMTNFKMHPMNEGNRKISTSDNSHYSKLAVVIPVMMLLGPDYRLSALPKSQTKLDKLENLRDTDKLGVIKHFLQVITERGDHKNFLKKGWKSVVKSADCSSYLNHLEELANDYGYYSWAYVNRICDRDDDDYDEDADVVQMTSGIPFELGLVLRYLIRSFPIPNDTQNKWHLTDAQKAQLVNRVVYRWGVNPPTPLPPLW
jgi:hypothetical protein